MFFGEMKAVRCLWRRVCNPCLGLTIMQACCHINRLWPELSMLWRATKRPVIADTYKNPGTGPGFLCGYGRRLTDPHPGVAEHAHPGAVFAPVIGMPGVLYGAEQAFRVRHHDGDAAVAVSQAGDAVR